MIKNVKDDNFLQYWPQHKETYYEVVQCLEDLILRTQNAFDTVCQLAQLQEEDKRTPHRNMENFKVITELSFH